MLNITFDFAWERPADANGFAWDDGRLARVEGVPFTNYKPLTEYSGLFRTFADLEPTLAAVLDFVNRYGHPSYRYGHSGAVFDTLADWKRMIARMKGLVGIWDALCQTDWPTLRTLLGSVYRVHLPSASHNELAIRTAELLFREVAVMTFAPLLGLVKVDADNTASMQVQWRDQSKGLLLNLIPVSLWQAMYFQFADAIHGNKRYQHCEGCGKWFVLSPGRNRADRQTCSDSCRVKLYRQRQQRAREMHAKGITAAKIAEVIGSEVKTIKTWIKKRKG